MSSPRRGGLPVLTEDKGSKWGVGQQTWHQGPGQCSAFIWLFPVFETSYYVAQADLYITTCGYLSSLGERLKASKGNSVLPILVRISTLWIFGRSVVHLSLWWATSEFYSRVTLNLQSTITPYFYLSTSDNMAQRDFRETKPLPYLQYTVCSTTANYTSEMWSGTVESYSSFHHIELGNLFKSVTFRWEPLWKAEVNALFTHGFYIIYSCSFMLAKLFPCYFSISN